MIESDNVTKVREASLRTIQETSQWENSTAIPYLVLFYRFPPNSMPPSSSLLQRSVPPKAGLRSCKMSVIRTQGVKRFQERTVILKRWVHL